MLQNHPPRLILASGSEARRALLGAAGLTFTAEAAGIDEDEIRRGSEVEGVAPADTALMLAGLKAERIGRLHPEALTMGADQILVCEGRWFRKPDGIEAARAQLLALRGRLHVLETAVVCCIQGQTVWRHAARPRLVMRDFSDAFLDAYLEAEGGRVSETVGAYRVEGLGIHLFDRIEGEQAAILGLPLLPLLAFLRQYGVVTT
jgi:septum formation protein